MPSYDVENEKQNPYFYNSFVVPVPVIASFDAQGNIRPLYFRHEGLKLKIDHIKWKNTRMQNFIKYCCQVTLQDRIQEVILYYHKGNCIWTMEKIKDG